MSDNIEQVQILCNPDDKNIDAIAHRMAAIQKAISTNTLVAISCYDEEAAKDVILMTIITKDEGNGFLQYAPIGEVFYPGDMRFEKLTPPSAAIPTVEKQDAKN